MHIGVNTLGRFVGYDEEDVYLKTLITTMREVQPSIRFTILTDARSHDVFADWDRVYIDGEARADGAAHARTAEKGIKQAGVEILFTPLKNAPMAGSFPCVPYALDVDSIEAENRLAGRRGTSRYRELRKACARARAILAPSEFLRKRLLEVLGVPINHTVVAHPGVDPSFETPERSLVEPPFILASGDLATTGNVRLLREAFRKLSDDFPHNLVVVGRPCPGEPDDWGPRVMRLHQCPVQTRAGLYQHCDAFVSTSLTEGAMVTLLEAVRAGSRPVVARIGGVEEIAGSIPIYYNRESEASLVAAIRRVLQEGDTDRAGAISFGRQRVAEYTWDKTAWKALRAFKQQRM